MTPNPPQVPNSVLNAISDATQGEPPRVGHTLQTLWSGYGQIVRLHFADASVGTGILKLISPPDEQDHPRGWNTGTSHQRKIKSYQVENSWYTDFSGECDQSCKVPSLIASGGEDNIKWILLEDLSVDYPVLRDQLSINEISVCLHWLANFHARFLNRQPDSLWSTGTYWHLATRPDEFSAMSAGKLKSSARALDERLTNCEFQTIVHGDAKVANFCFSQNMKSVSAVDFQYVGGGVGVKDLAYFLGSCVPENSLHENENELLDIYFAALHAALSQQHGYTTANSVEEAWRELYAIAWTDFYRFLAGWMPGHKKITSYTTQLANRAYQQLASHR